MRKMLCNVVLVTFFGCVFVMTAMAGSPTLPTRENPLVIDTVGKKVMIYTEVNEMNAHQSNVHWGVVFKDGRFQDRAILKAYSNHLAFYDALIKIGAKPGNNLTKDTVGSNVAGDFLDVTATWHGLGKELKLSDIFSETGGKGFSIRFGGNRKAAEAQNTGCITCLESCWIAVASNSAYPQTGSIKRFVNPNARFQGKADALPKDGQSVILTYRVKGA